MESKPNDEDIEKAVNILKKFKRSENEVNFLQDFFLGYDALRKQFVGLPPGNLRNLCL